MQLVKQLLLAKQLLHAPYARQHQNEATKTPRAEFTNSAGPHADEVENWPQVTNVVLYFVHVWVSRTNNHRKTSARAILGKPIHPPPYYVYILRRYYAYVGPQTRARDPTDILCILRRFYAILRHTTPYYAILRHITPYYADITPTTGLPRLQGTILRVLWRFVFTPCHTIHMYYADITPIWDHGRVQGTPHYTDITPTRDSRRLHGTPSSYHVNYAVFTPYDAI
jgi:hypothetical protein